MKRRYLFHLFDGRLLIKFTATLKEALKEMFKVANYNYLDSDIIERCLSGFDDDDCSMIYLYNALIGKFDSDYKIEYVAAIETEIFLGE